MKNAANISTKTGVGDQTLRLNHGDTEKEQETRQTCVFSENKGDDSIPFQGIPSNLAGARARRISRLQLEEIKIKLSERDLQILTTLQEYHFVSSRQIQRLYFIDGSSAQANSRATNRALKRLNGQGLIAHLKRRIGGWRSGSASQVWHLTEPGERLLRLESSEKQPRKRPEEPSPQFLEYTLAIAEAAVNLTCLYRSGEEKLKLLSPKTSFSFRRNGKVATLKPDLYAVILDSEYEDHFFLEIVPEHEPPAKTLRKAQLYLDCYATSVITDKLELYPYVVWIISDAKQQRSIVAKFLDDLPKSRPFFRIISPAKLAETPGLLAASELCLECPDGAT